MAKKNCSKCKVLKPYSEFGNHKKNKDGLNIYCKTCTRAASQKWKQNNKEKVLERSREYYHSNKETVKNTVKASRLKKYDEYLAYNRAWKAANKDQRAEYNKAWREANKEHIAITSRVWYEANHEKQKAKRKIWRESNKGHESAYAKEWRKKNPHRANAIAAKRRANQLKATPPWFEKEKVELVYKKAKEWGMTVDHVIPLQGKDVCGLHCWANLQLLDGKLNSGKNNRDYPNN